MKDFSVYIPAILKTLPHRPMTKHYKQHLVSRQLTQYGRMMIYGDNWYLKVADGVHVTDGDEVIPIPLFVARAINGHLEVTRTFGPYMFWNDFDKTQEAKYLMKMLAYRKLTPQVQAKIRTILTDYKPWIDWDDEFIKVLSEREHDLDITQPWEVKNGN